MSAYLKFHQLEHPPFQGTGGESLVLATEALQQAYAEIKSGLEDGSPRICLSGGQGIGKSSLARALPKLLDEDARCVLIRDPSRDWPHLKAAIIKELDLEGGQMSRASLCKARTAELRIVVVVDQAEQLSGESLEHLDVLLGYRDDEGEQLLQCVLLANLEGASLEHDAPLHWWLDELTTRQLLTLAPIPESGLRSFVDKHLENAGAHDGSLFSDGALVAIHRYTGGVPGVVGALCEELLDRAAACELRSIDARLVAEVSGDDAALQPELGSAPIEESRESLLDHSNTPLRPEAEPRTAPGPSPVRSEPEPELELEQGLLPVQQNENYTDEAGFFARAGADPSSGARRKVGPAFTGPVPSSRGGGRMVRNLIGLAIIAVLAAVVHASWSSWNTPAPASQARGAPPGARMARQPAPIVEPNLPRGTTSFAPRPAEQTQVLEAAAAEEGLTADLRLRSSAAIDASNGITPGARRAPDPDPSLSLDELKRIAEQAVPEPDGFEPWTQQGRESAPEPRAAEPPANR